MSPKAAACTFERTLCWTDREGQKASREEMQAYRVTRQTACAVEEGWLPQSSMSYLLLDQPLKMDPAGQHGREQRQHVLLHFADGGGQGADDSVEPHLLDDVLKDGGRLACDPAQGLRGQGTDSSHEGTGDRPIT